MMASVGKEIAYWQRIYYTDLKNKIRKIDLMRAANLAKKDYEQVRGLNAERVAVKGDICQLIQDYRRAWKIAMGA